MSEWESSPDPGALSPLTGFLPSAWAPSHPRGGGEKRQHSCWKLVLTAVCVFRPHSGCHYDSILGSHLAGRVSVTRRKAHQGHQQSKLYLCPLPAPVPNLMHQPAFWQRLKARAETPMIRCWSPGPYSYRVCGPQVEICKETFPSMAHPDRK